MPSSPKFFTARPSSSKSRRSTVLIICFLVGLAGFFLGFVAFSKQGLGYNCKYDKPISVSVVWDRTNSGNSFSSSSSKNGANGNSNGGQKRYKVTGFVGVQTGFRSAGRRRALRRTWFPSDHLGLQRYKNVLAFSLMKCF